MPLDKTEYASLQNELQTQMISDYPEVFDGPPVSGFDCPPGWQKLVRSTLEKLVEYAKAHPEVKIKVAQVKEKYGGLRIYVDFDNRTDEVNEILYQAERASYKICDDCGEPGALRHGNWIRTLCEEHANGSWPNPDWFQGDDELYEWTRKF